MAKRHDMKPSEVLEHARKIAAEYKRDGIDLTLRQLYYQFVARGLAESSQQTYKRIGAILTKARYEGAFPIDWIDDRGRTNDRGAATRNDVDSEWGTWKIADFVAAAPRIYLGRDSWWRQPYYVSVWVEKEALGGIVGKAAEEKGVGWMACKGYPSVSALREWLAGAWLACCRRRYYDDADKGRGEHMTHEGLCREAVVLYLGDHDPDGLEIPQAAERGVCQIMAVTGWDVKLTFRRIALTRSQIAQYRPPPFPAKQTSARYKKCVEATGLNDAWELDALEPRVLRQLIQDEVDQLYDRSISIGNRSDVEDARSEMEEEVCGEGFASRAYHGEIPEFDREIPAATQVLAEQSQQEGVTFDDDGHPATWRGDALDGDSQIDMDEDYDGEDTDDGEED